MSTSGFSGYSGFRSPSLEAIEFAKASLEQAGYAEQARLQNIQFEKLILEGERLRRQVVIIIAITILAFPPLLAICLKFIGK